MLLATMMNMGKFFDEVGLPADSVSSGAPESAVVEHFIEVAKSDGYWFQYLTIMLLLVFLRGKFDYLVCKYNYRLSWILNLS